MCEKYVIGYWMWEGKRRKMSWPEYLENDEFIIKLIDVNVDLESQGPIHVFLHKLSDTLTHSDFGDHNAGIIISRIQEYISKHSELIVIDPFENIRNLQNRYKSYVMIQNGIQLNDVFTPDFVELQTNNVTENLTILQNNRIKFPLICKPLIAHGSNDAHKMMIMFNEKDLKDCQPPCVAQNFINHNAILYKIYIVGKQFHVVQRPSLRNFYQEDCALFDTIFFYSHMTCKSGSKSKWSILSENDVATSVKPNYSVFEKIVEHITKIFGLTLVGVDVVIENHTKKYAIIDVNVFPGYDGYPNFFQHLLNSVKDLLAERDLYKLNSTKFSGKKYLNHDLEPEIENDEKRKCSAL